MSVSRSTFTLVDDCDRAYFGHDSQESDQVDYLTTDEGDLRALLRRRGRHLRQADAGDTAIQAFDTLMLTVPNQVGVDHNAHAIESILRYVAPELGWR